MDFKSTTKKKHHVGYNFIYKKIYINKSQRYLQMQIQAYFDLVFRDILIHTINIGTEGNAITPKRIHSCGLITSYHSLPQ